MRTYVYENLKLEQKEGKGTLFVNGRLVFKGDGYVALNMFIDKSGNAPEVRNKFKNQLTMREQVKWKSKTEQPKKPEIIPEEPKKEKVIRRPKRIDKLFK